MRFELRKKDLSRVLRMSFKRSVLLILLYMVGCQQVSVGQESVIALDNNLIGLHDDQLQINRTSLLEGSSDEIRLRAASVMILSHDAAARAVLLDILGRSENESARRAVCRALNQSGVLKKEVYNKADFIEPLMEIIANGTQESARLASDAMLIFEYRKISKSLGKIVFDKNRAAKNRLSAIYALKLQPDMRAIFKLMELLEDENMQIVSAVRDALISQGIPIGKDRKERKKIIDTLKRNGRNAFLRDRVVRQESDIRDIESRLGHWKKLYLTAIDQIYNGKDEQFRGKFLIEQLNSSSAVLRLWAIGKVTQWRTGTNPRLPAEIGPVLLYLVSDTDRDVRLSVAELLSLASDLNSAEQLLKQLKAEDDRYVRLKLFRALGSACYYAFIPNSSIKIEPQIRIESLKLASEYMSSRQAPEVRAAAEVIKKLLEQNGLEASNVDEYLLLLSDRYKQEKQGGNDSLCLDMLNAMAGLCGQSVYKAQAAKLFLPLFEQAIYDENELIRETACDGITYIDKAKALEMLRKDFINDTGAGIRKKIIALAGDVGGSEDINWLSAKIGSSSESDPCWQAMLMIFRRDNGKLVSDWTEMIISNEKLSQDQKTAFLEIAERKAIAEDDQEKINIIREKLADLYIMTNRFDAAAKYLGLLSESAIDSQARQSISLRLLDIYLKSQNIEAAAHLVNNFLLETDLDPSGPIMASLDDYLSKQPSDGSLPDILKLLVAIELTEERPLWLEILKTWQQKFPTQPDPNHKE